jgi:hypothetical protein
MRALFVPRPFRLGAAAISRFCQSKLLPTAQIWSRHSAGGPRARNRNRGHCDGNRRRIGLTLAPDSSQAGRAVEGSLQRTVAILKAFPQTESDGPTTVSGGGVVVAVVAVDALSNVAGVLLGSGDGISVIGVFCFVGVGGHFDQNRLKSPEMYIAGTNYCLTNLERPRGQ